MFKLCYFSRRAGVRCHDRARFRKHSTIKPGYDPHCGRLLAVRPISLPPRDAFWTVVSTLIFADKNHRNFLSGKGNGDGAPDSRCPSGDERHLPLEVVGDLSFRFSSVHLSSLLRRPARRPSSHSCAFHPSHPMVRPPSTTKSTPTTKEAASEHSQRTASAISSGSPILPMG